MPQEIRHHLIEVDLETEKSLLNTLDQSPFHERDLDHDAEAFIVGWARELPSDAPLALSFTVHRGMEAGTPAKIRELIHHYFAARERQKRQELRRMLWEGRVSLAIGLSLLGVTFGLSRLIPDGTALGGYAKEGLLICGCVGMWHPIDIHLYQWWPLLREARLYRRLSEARVSVHAAP